jgi:hypothetical protein
MARARVVAQIEQVQTEDVLDMQGIGQGRRQMHRKLDRTMWRDRQVGLGAQGRDLREFGDAAHLPHIGLQVIRRIAADIVPEVEPVAELRAQAW